MNALTCHFEALDTWFFRESRPQGSIGASELGSVFPPPVNTLLGAVRTAIGDAFHQQHGTDWRQFAELNALQAIIGFADNLGPLRCEGPFLSLKGERLYPAPANLMRKDDHYFLLGLGPVVQCDLGPVRLPCFPAQVPGLKELAGAKPLESSWLTSAGWANVLSGKAPSAAQVISQAQLFSHEPRLGIARDNQRRAVSQGMLYQTRHLRLHEGVAVSLDIHGLPEQTPVLKNSVIRLGGEGRQAALHFSPAEHQLPAAPQTLKGQAVLYSLTPTPCAEGLPNGIPAGFTPTQHNGAHAWQGELGGVALRILSVACARVQREGGWDMAQHQARPVTSYLAAGSVLYVEAQNGDNSALHALHGQLLTQEHAYGRGQFLLGCHA